MASLRRSQSRLEDGGDAVAQALISDIDARAGHAAALLEVLDRSSWRTKARTGQEPRTCRFWAARGLSSPFASAAESSKQVHDSPVAAVPPIVTKQPHAGDGGHAQAVDSGETARARAAVVPPLNLPIIGSAETPRAIDNPKLGEDASDSRCAGPGALPPTGQEPHRCPRAGPPRKWLCKRGTSRRGELMYCRSSNSSERGWIRWQKGTWCANHLGVRCALTRPASRPYALPPLFAGHSQRAR